MGISSPFLPTLMLTDLLTDFWVSTSMTSPSVAALGAGVDDAGSMLLPGLVVVVVVVLLLLELETVFVAGSVGGSSVVVEKATLDSWR